MNSTPTICISCGEPMAPGAERAPSLGNPNQCVPCCTGHQLPAEGSAAYRATDGPTPAAGGEALRVWRDCHGADVRAAGDTLPPATAPAACISRDAGPETTAAGGNPLTSDLYVDTMRPDRPWDEESEALTLELRRKGIQSIPADTHQDDHAWRMLL